MIAERARKADAAARRICQSQGELGLDELRALYPDSYFYWIEDLGLMTLWAGNPGRISNTLSFMSSYIHSLKTGEVLKNKTGDGLPEYLFPDEAKVAIVMES